MHLGSLGLFVLKKISILCNKIQEQATKGVSNVSTCDQIVDNAETYQNVEEEAIQLMLEEVNSPLLDAEQTLQDIICEQTHSFFFCDNKR